MEPLGIGKIFNVDSLTSISVPHILEKIFFSLDYPSFHKCMAVSTDWNGLFSSEKFQKLRKDTFREEIQMELRRALRSHNIQSIKKLLSNNMEYLNYVHENVGTPLCVAARRGHAGLVQFLLDKGADINEPKGYLHTALYVAADEGHMNVVKMLLEGGAAPDNGGEYGVTPVHIAAMSGHVEVVKQLLERGASVNPQINGTGMTPLHGAAIMGHKDVVKLLLESGAYHGSANIDGHTPLMMAQYYGFERIGHEEVVDLLKMYGGL